MPVDSHSHNKGELGFDERKLYEVKDAFLLAADSTISSWDKD